MTERDEKKTAWGGGGGAAIRLRSESELFTGDTSKDNHSRGSMIREHSP